MCLQKNMLNIFKIDFENGTSFIGILQDNNVVKFLGAPMITKLIYFLMFAKPPVIKRSIQTFGLCFSVVIVLGSEGRGGNVYLLLLMQGHQVFPPE